MITDDEAEKAVDWMRDNALKAAKARAERAYIEEFRKVLKAQIMREGTEALGAQEARAYSDPRYMKHLEALRAAVEQDEYLRFMREAACAKVEAWRSQSANLRAA